MGVESEAPWEEAYGKLLFDEDLAEVDADTDLIIGFEEERQLRRLILIPSESIAPKAVRQALGSVFNNIYAEGYPPLRMTRDEIAKVLDFPHQLAYYRRYGDRRFYKGTEYVHFVEALAQRRAAECFATKEVSADRIFVNIQPLSGAAANNCVYDAFVPPGETVMGMSLTHGGHLTHGSPYNRSGQRYNIVSYQVDPAGERLDYGEIMRLAREHRPKMIIAGYTSYPWSVDWGKFREIADAVGAILMADVAHPAGLIIAGLYPNPIGLADVITLTTHKTLCGPRGAMILTTDPEKARRIDRAVFPGEQGGPHVNKFAAIAVALKIAQTEKFRELQHRIIDNAQHLAQSLQDQSLRLAYGGTDTHMLLVDLKSVSGDSAHPLRGEVAARILDLCGIVCNKNTIPGDESMALATGLRLGTPWVSQRGMGRPEMERLAEIMAQVLKEIKPYRYIGRAHEIGRGKIGEESLHQAARDVAELAGRAIGSREGEGKGYPHYSLPPASSPCSNDGHPSADRLNQELEAAKNSAALFDLKDTGLLEVRGRRARPFIQEITTGNLFGLPAGQCRYSFLVDKEARVIDDVLILRLDGSDVDQERYLLLTNPINAERVKAWLRELSDGYVLFDDQDLAAKIEGPVIVEDLAQDVPGDRRRMALTLEGPAAMQALARAAAPLADLEPFSAREAEIGGLKAWAIRADWKPERPRVFLLTQPEVADRMQALFLEGGRSLGLRPAGPAAWQRLREETGLPTYEEDDRPRAEELMAAGLSHLFDLSQPYFIGQRLLAQKAVLSPTGKVEFEWREQEGPLKRSCLYEEHVKLRARLVPFAGWNMPVWYSRISEEHRAVREQAGLFDVSHMGTIEVSGAYAMRFLDLVTTNYLPRLKPGRSHYSYILSPKGEVIDDVTIYCRSPERYMMVANAVNHEKVLAWFKAVNSKQVLIDLEVPEREVEGTVVITDLKDAASGEEQRVDLALQGPSSLAILQELANGDLAARLAKLRRFEFVEAELAGIPALLSRSGYTGEEWGFELYLHPNQAPRMWNLLLEKGERFGIRPCGLGARDSTRTEAGLPLHGHELAGEHHISPLEAGYGFFVKFHKPFFIGRQALLEREGNLTRELVRFRVEARGARAIRSGDPVVNRRGDYIGAVTSCALVEGRQLGLTYIDRRYAAPGTELGLFPLSRHEEVAEKPKGQLSDGDSVLLHEQAVVLARFPRPEELKAEGGGA